MIFVAKKIKGFLENVQNNYNRSIFCVVFGLDGIRQKVRQA